MDDARIKSKYLLGRFYQEVDAVMITGWANLYIKIARFFTYAGVLFQSIAVLII